MKLDVHVRGKRISQLYREADNYLLTYLPRASPDDFVSLTMPVREQSWLWPRDLHPFFRQNLPEGAMLDALREQFGPLLDGTDLTLLGLVGGFGIGRVAVTPEGGQPTGSTQVGDPAGLNIDSLLSTPLEPAAFSDLVRQYARASVSGAVPKVLEPDAQVEAGSQAQLLKASFRTARHIIKGSGAHSPYLGFNEFYSMRVLERLNVVPVARGRMSEDGQLLAVERFDLDSQGQGTFGLEDACSLLGLPPSEKFRPSLEAVLGALRAYLPAKILHQDLVHFGWHQLVNYIVRNADCHAKNIALYYRSRDDVQLTPVYDIVTTQAYPYFAHSPPGLSVGGRKEWAPGRALEQFFKARLGISPSDYRQMVERLCESAVEVGREVAQAAANEPRWRDIAKNMLHAWNDGMAAIHSPKRDGRFKKLAPTIEAHGFSEPDKAPPEPKIGRSELLSKR